MSAIIMTPAQTQRYYNAYFGRPADPSGLSFWVNGVTADPVASVIKLFGSPTTPEFAALYPAGTSPEVFLTRVYANMFNRGPDADGLKFWADAFRASVAGGIDEGTARAWIVVEIERAAWGQTGTNDKFSLVNKQLVAEAMTASVKQYGTEAGYLTDLPKARVLLANVDHTQASVDTALARIKFGYVDGVVPDTGVPSLPVSLLDNPQSLIDASGTLTLNNAVKEIIKVDAAADSPFASKVSAISGLHLAAAVSLANFTLGTDKIDISSFHVQYSGTASTVRETGWGASTFYPSIGVNPVYQKAYAGFFSDKPIVFSGWSSPSAGASSYVFIDVNNDRNLDANDVMISLPGISTTAASDAIFIL